MKYAINIGHIVFPVESFYQRNAVCCVQTAASIMDEWWSMQKSVNNLVLDSRRKVRETLLKRYTELEHLEQLCSGNDKQFDEVTTDLDFVNSNANTMQLLITGQIIQT